MLEQMLKLYFAFMATNATGALPHFVGPPGAGKSTVAKQLADLVGKKLHVVNVSRINPLGLEGTEMPDKENTALQLLISELWTQAEEGDIYLFDEFLRGFPEVYNGLLDIFTSREVRGFEMPKVFIMAASNTVATYDPALEDRLLHIPVADPRSSGAEFTRLAELLLKELGLMPEMLNTAAMDHLMHGEVLPTFGMLDSYKKGSRTNQGVSFEGSSIRKLIAQAKLRIVESTPLKELISYNNQKAAQQNKMQYVLLLNGRGKNVPSGYQAWAEDPAVQQQLTGVQRTNLELNLQLIEMENAKSQPDEGTDEYDDLLNSL